MKQANEQRRDEEIIQLLVIDDEENMRHMLGSILSRFGYKVESAPNGLEGLERVKLKRYDFILCDLKMPKMGGMEFMEKASEYLKDTTVIVMSAYGSIDVAVDAMKAGAYDYISKPFKSDEVHLTLKKAEERESLKRENTRLKEQIRSMEEREADFQDIVGKSRPMQYVYNLAEKVAQYDTTVLITGESGTGKELIAKAIHTMSKRSDKIFIPVNCGESRKIFWKANFLDMQRARLPARIAAKRVCLRRPRAERFF